MKIKPRHKRDLRFEELTSDEKEQALKKLGDVPMGKYRFWVSKTGKIERCLEYGILKDIFSY